MTCDCPPGYVGRRCEQCAAGYTGNPNIPGDSCRPGHCSADGSLSVQGDAYGQCQCKVSFTLSKKKKHCKQKKS